MNAYLAMVRTIANHPIGRQQKLLTWWRMIRWQLKSRLSRGAHVVNWVNGARLSVERGMHGATGNIYFGLHEYADMAFFAHLLRPGDVFVDVGANVGTYSILAAKACGATVHCFEPAEETLPRLRRNIELNGVAALVTVHPIALGGKKGNARFTRDCDCTNKFAHEDAADIQLVPVERLDTVLADVHAFAMKVDVEGAEPLVFAGADGVLNRLELCAIEVETLEPGVRDIIERAGFVERWYDPATRRLSAKNIHLMANNSLFIRNEKLVAERLVAGAPVMFAGLRI